MDVVKLAKKLRNELVRNPKKSAVLALICVVALYFWFPLVRGWVGGKSKKTPAVTAHAAALVTTTNTAIPTAPTVSAEPMLPWNDVLRLVKQDPLMSPAGLKTENRNPFSHSEELLKALAARATEEAAVKPPPAEAATPVEITPHSLGLVLQGTLVGPRTRSATLNGRSYTEQSRIRLAAGPSSKERVEFTLTQVHSDRVMLVRDGESYELKLVGPQLTMHE